jgi:hypothetical protein
MRVRESPRHEVANDQMMLVDKMAVLVFARCVTIVRSVGCLRVYGGNGSVSRGPLTAQEEPNRQQTTNRRDSYTHRDDGIDVGHTLESWLVVVSKCRANRHALFEAMTCIQMLLSLRKPVR